VKEIGGHSSKIGLALFATALGLFTAIPLVFSHVLFKEWIGKFETKMKAASQKLVTLVANYKKDPKLLDRDDEDEKRPPRPAPRREARSG
jgi:biopolymer transport protein ExbB